MIIDPADHDAAQNYKFLIGSILPRPIAWVSTRSVDGVDNLAPVSFFTAAGRKPPRVHLSLQARADGETLKDTFVNIRDTKEFVVNLAVLPLAHEVHRSAFEFDTGVDEFEMLNVAKEPCEVVKPPRVKESPISFECVLFHIFGEGDRYLGPALAAEMAGLFANSTLHLVEQAGHYPQYDRPETVAALLTQTRPVQRDGELR